MYFVYFKIMFPIFFSLVCNGEIAIGKSHPYTALRLLQYQRFALKFLF